MKATKVIMILVWAVCIVGGGVGGGGEENWGRGEKVVCGVKEDKHSQ